VVVQDDVGLWYILKNTSYDDVSGTLTSTTTHFSDYSRIRTILILPAAASVATLGTVDLRVKFCRQGQYSGTDDTLVGLDATCTDGNVPAGTFSNWAVNGVTGGSAAFGRVAATGAQSARFTAPPSVPASNPVTVTVQARGRRGIRPVGSSITVGNTWYGTVVMQQGGAKSEAQVVWTWSASYQGIETYLASGTVHYTPETDYGPSCSFVSMSPRDGPITPDPYQGALFINRQNGPAWASGFGTVALIVRTCFTCEGWTEPDCSEGPAPAWFAADSLAVSADGESIYWDYTDNGQLPPVHTTVDFKKGSPPVALTVRK
jgi:hypothetical protein